MKIGSLPNTSSPASSDMAHTGNMQGSNGEPDGGPDSFWGEEELVLRLPELRLPQRDCA